MPQASKKPGAKAAVEKLLEKLEKIPAWQLTNVRNKSEVIEEARNKGRKVHFASLMDLCILKNSELELQFQKYKGRVVLRGDIVRDDSGSYAVLTEQGSSASQMTAAKFMDIISRLPGCAGQAADAVSAYTQVKMDDAPTLLKIPKSECPDIWMRLPKHKMAQIMVQYRRPSRSSWAKSVRSFSGRTTVGTTMWESSIGTRLGKVSLWECLFVHRARGLLLSVHVDVIKTGWKEAELESNTESTDERHWFGRTNIVPWQRVFGLHSMRMSD